MVAGPYRSGSDDPLVWDDNLRRLNEAAYALVQQGHVPVIGVNMALPIIQAMGPSAYDEIMLPLSLALADRCDAVLRIGGRSTGADAEVERFAASGRPVFHALDEIPPTRDNA